MVYAVVELGDGYRGYIVKRALFARGNRVFLGSYNECLAWIAGFRKALEQLAEGTQTTITHTVVPWEVLTEAS